VFTIINFLICGEGDASVFTLAHDPPKPFHHVLSEVVVGLLLGTETLQTVTVARRMKWFWKTMSHWKDSGISLTTGYKFNNFSHRFAKVHNFSTQLQ